MNIPETQYSSTERERIRQFSKEADLEMKIISGIPVFTITTDRRDEVIPKIARFFGENTIFRIINTQFTDDAIEFGTDKNSVDEHDFRRVADGAGYDIW